MLDCIRLLFYPFLQDGNSPLHEAASSGSSLCVAELLAKGARVNVVNEVLVL